MKLQVDEAKLKGIMAARGIGSYQDLAVVANKLGADIHWRTIYTLAKNSNWTRQTLEAVCSALDCKPQDFIPGLESERDA